MAVAGRRTPSVTVDPDVGVWMAGRVGEAMFGKASTEARVATAAVLAAGPCLIVSAPVVVPGKVHDGDVSADTDGAFLSAMGIQPDDDRVAPPSQTPLHVCALG